MHKTHGFTTLELIIALLILGILIAVAWLSYSEHATAKSRRLAWVALQDTAQWLHAQRAQGGGYDGVVLPFKQSPAEGAADYTLSLARAPLGTFPATSAQAFTLVATPVARDEACGALLLDHTGRRGVTGAAGLRACAPH